jgi:Trypsin-like peptidase domain/Putative peptidoglycan binding domain
MGLRGSGKLRLAVALGSLADLAIATSRVPAETADKVAQSYAGLALAERLAIASDLIWTGDYDGLIDGAFGERAIAAVKAFQSRNGDKATGVLNPPERALLAAAARAKADAVGWRLVDDHVTGARLGIATKLMPQTSAHQNGMHFTSAHGEAVVETFRTQDPGTTLQAVFDERRKQAGKKLDYSVIKPEFFVISGLLGGVKKFYERAEIKNGEVRGFSARHDLALDGTMARVVIAMSSAFEAFPRELGGPAVHRQVEYATGIIIDAAGHVLSDRRATDGCFALTLAGFGPAERVAEDRIADLALLRLYGAPKVPAVPLAADGANPANDVTVVGIPDPQAQRGGAAVSALPAHLAAALDGPKRALDPVPGAGFSGAAALDETGRLVGMVELTAPALAGASAGPGAQAVMVTTGTIRAFLLREQVVVADGAARARGEFAAGITRVICTRK